MIFGKRLRWQIQRKSFCNRGIWKKIHDVCRNLSEVSQILNGK